ncbi:Ig-like domain-containing protein [Polaribacter batillariae]|uniref:Ig-like domain-containing protein n=1 Tax=Polaribacter batillariae TaxID=2808900 RepID=A0ABX7T087_9FLAO|nr:Ig-like domain-containing protein [Polaribacter batillariae]QTD38671.1 Ig-like domain-containing protein [Polaribacter batillariae]
MKFSKNLILLIVFAVLISSCAKTGRPDGGPKDEDAPLFVTANPPYESINFKGKEIKLYFNEFVKLKDLNKQLVVSPPLKNPLIISPQGTASKFLKIEILDTLTTNTTYIFNFGNAVEDNNESNVLEGFKYVFSTGTYIDSLKIFGEVQDAFLREKPKRTNIVLYKIDSTYTDSLIYKKKPNYVTSALDTTKFNFSNLKEGKYRLIALQENSSDYLFNPKLDKIGFYNDTISLPRDSILSKPIILFKEIQPYQFRRGKEITKGKIQFGYNGKIKDLKVNLLSKVPDSFKSVSRFEKDKDTLNYWFTPIDVDSLNFTVTNDIFIDTVTVRLRKKKIDSLSVSFPSNKLLHFRDTLFLKSNNPITAIDTSKISLIDADTLRIPFNIFNSKKENKLGFIFEKKQKSAYNLKLLPNAITDIYETTIDTLRFSFKTQEIEDYGKITLNVENSKNENLIIDLISIKEKNKIIERRYISSSESLVFDLLEPKSYAFRAIIDRNKNNFWDTGNYLEMKQPEKIIYFKTQIDLRANNYVFETFFVN